MITSNLPRRAISHFIHHRKPSVPLPRKMHIQSIPMWTGSSDNYAYLVVDDKSRDAIIIDPANPKEVLPFLKEKIAQTHLNLTAIINTHHHQDHAGGNVEILRQHEFKNLAVIGGRDCDAVQRTPKHGDIFKLGQISITALHTPCHTQDSICWLMEDETNRVVFTGDTLFHGGGGRFFEGTAAEMNTALNQTLSSLPDNTVVFPGHEYTKSNARFGLSVLPNESLQRLLSFAEKNAETQGRFTIGDEKLHNVFMRLDDPIIQQATQKTDPIDVMTRLREMKNQFK